MTLRNTFMIVASLVTLGTSSAFALENNPTPPGKAAFEKLTPEQKEAKKAEFKQKLDAMTPEQREQFKAERKAKWKEHYDNATPEQQEKMREHRKERRAQRHNKADLATTPAK